MTDIPFTAGPPETVLPALRPDVEHALLAAEAAGDLAAVRAVAAAEPQTLLAWAILAELTDDPVERYAYARVGYHRGLDTLRANGWRGSGYVRWEHPSNRGFLRALDALRGAAGDIGEPAEETRCDLFLHQLDPEWDRRRSG
ncbi:MAG: DUF3151 family protein [Acidimicrobiales bacterium]